MKNSPLIGANPKIQSNLIFILIRQESNVSHAAKLDTASPLALVTLLLYELIVSLDQSLAPLNMYSPGVLFLVGGCVSRHLIPYTPISY